MSETGLSLCSTPTRRPMKTHRQLLRRTPNASGPLPRLQSSRSGLAESWSSISIFDAARTGHPFRLWIISRKDFELGEIFMKVGLFVTNQQQLATDMVAALDDQIAMVELARDRGWNSLFTGQHYLNEGDNKQMQAVPFLARL